MKEDVKFKCPLCGNEWVEEQDTEDDWFGLATTQTLCEECSRKAVIYQQCLYEEMTGNKPTKEKCGFHCSEETCEYCIETTTKNGLAK